MPLEDALIEDPIQVMYNGGVEDMRALFEWLREEVSGCSIQMTEYVHRDFSLVDVTSLEATKGRALAWRARSTGADA